MIGIYKIENLITKKIYIGQSTNIEKRFYDHKRRYFLLNENTVLYKSMRKYGLENFDFKIIEKCNKEELNEKEIFYIAFYNSLVPFGYNINIGGNCGFNEEQFQNSIKIKEKIKNDLNLSLSEIAEEYFMTLQNISDINRGLTWKDENLSYPLRPFRKEQFCIDCNIKIDTQSNRCRKCANKARQTVPPISRTELKTKIRNQSFESIGKEFKITGNGIKKWCLKYNLPSTKKEIKSYSDNEWILI